jgi:hypothetical protein
MHLSMYPVLSASTAPQQNASPRRSTPQVRYRPALSEAKRTLPPAARGVGSLAML